MGKKIAPTTSEPMQKKAKTLPCVPTVSAMTGFIAGSSGTRPPVADDKLYIAIMKYSSRGSVYNEVFEDTSMYVMQMKTNAYPSPLFKLKTVLGIQWKEENKEVVQSLPSETQSAYSHSEEKGPLECFTDFESTFRTLFVWAPKKGNDVDCIAYEPQRCGFYFTGRAEEAKNLLMHLDNVFHFRLTHRPEDMDPLPTLPHLEIGFPDDMDLVIDAVADEMHCPFTLCQGQCFQMSVFHLPPPCFPSRNVVMTVEMVTMDEVHLVFSGNTKPYQQGFFDLGAKLATVDSPHRTYPEYYRVWRNMNLQNSSKTIAFFDKVLSTQCLAHSPIMVRINNDAGTSLRKVHEFLDHIGKQPNVQIDH